MKFSFVRALQWGGAGLVILVLVGLNWDFESEAGLQLNSSVDDSLSQGMRGYWKIDDGTGTNATDASGNVDTLAFVGSPSWVTGNIGPYALDFSGTGQYLSIADPSSGVLDFTDGSSFTLTGWFNRESSDTDDTIIAKRNGIVDTDDGYIVYIDDATDQLIFEASEISGTDEYQVASTSTFTTTGWHHFAVSWSDNATTNPVNLYVDGASQGTASGSTFANVGSLATALAFRIGAESDAGNPFDGKLDDTRVYGYALSADEVAKLAQTTAPAQPVDTSLVGHWTFDGPDIQVTTVIDRSGKGNNGTFNVANHKPRIGKLGQAFYVESGNGGIVVPVSNSLELGLHDLSISGWFSIPSQESSMGLVFKKSGPDTTEGYSLRIFDNAIDKDFRFVVADGVSVYYYYGYFSNSMRGTGWHHLACVIDRDQGVLFYLDGVFLSKYGSSVFDGTDITNGAENLSIAWWGDSGFGYDDVRIYNRALSAIDVASLYNMGK